MQFAVSFVVTGTEKRLIFVKKMMNWCVKLVIECGFAWHILVFGMLENIETERDWEENKLWIQSNDGCCTLDTFFHVHVFRTVSLRVRFFAVAFEHIRRSIAHALQFAADLWIECGGDVQLMHIITNCELFLITSFILFFCQRETRVDRKT